MWIFTVIFQQQVGDASPKKIYNKWNVNGMNEPNMVINMVINTKETGDSINNLPDQRD